MMFEQSDGQKIAQLKGALTELLRASAGWWACCEGQTERFDEEPAVMAAKAALALPNWATFAGLEKT